MHELSLIAEAVRIAVETAESAKAGRITALRLRVGALSGAVPEALAFAWEAACRGTMAEGADLQIETIPAVCWCPHCETEFEARDFLWECPRCRRVGGDLRRGREVEVAAVEMN